MKGFVACALGARCAGRRAAAAARRCTWRLSYDEEVGCLGVRGLIECWPRRRCGRGSASSASRPRWRSRPGTRASSRAAATCRGRAAHSALAPLAVNAIHLACDLVAAIRARAGGAGRARARATGTTTFPTPRCMSGGSRAARRSTSCPNRCELEFEIRNVAADDPGGAARPACGRRRTRSPRRARAGRRRPASPSR